MRPHFALQLFILIALESCVSKNQVALDYQRAVKEQNPHGTLIFFLMDGLSVETTQTLLAENSLPNIENLFLPNSKKFTLGRAQFPTLTYPNISSILTTRKVSEQPIIGNKIWHHGEIIDFESPLNRDTLNSLIEPYTVFSDLTNQKRSSVSIAAYFGKNATAQYPLDLNMGINYNNNDYNLVDGKLIDSLYDLLSKSKPSEWPEFIFVHLVGIDGYAHYFGKDSPKVFDQAKFIDRKLKAIFEIMKEATTHGHLVQSLMTSDHGMMNTSKSSHLLPLLEAHSNDAKWINQGRYLTIHFKKEFSPNSRKKLLEKIANQKGILASVLKEGNILTVLSSNKNYTIEYHSANCGDDGDYALRVDTSLFYCPRQLNVLTEKFFYPYFATNLATYFKSPQAPDALVLAAEDYSLITPPLYIGDHGGMTPGELFVPIFSWNLTINSQEPILPTYKLLEILRQQQN